MQLAGRLRSGAVSQVQLDAGLVLGNRGGTLILIGDDDTTIDNVSYAATQVRPGRTICFGRGFA